MKTKQPKERIKQWVNEYQGSGSPSYCTAYNIKRLALASAGVNVLASAGVNVLRIAVPLVELRRGEVVVNSDALADAVARRIVRRGYSNSYASYLAADVLAAIKKVGVR